MTRAGPTWSPLALPTARSTERFLPLAVPADEFLCDKGVAPAPGPIPLPATNCVILSCVPFCPPNPPARCEPRHPASLACDVPGLRADDVPPPLWRKKAGRDASLPIHPLGVDVPRRPAEPGTSVFRSSKRTTPGVAVPADL